MDFQHFATIYEIRESKQTKPELMNNNKAKQFICSMGAEPDTALWAPLLKSCTPLPAPDTSRSFHGAPG